MTSSIADILAAALQELIEAELTGTIGAEHGERTPMRVAQRNGHRPKLVSTPAGDIDAAIPKLRKGSFSTELLEPRRRIDKALWAVIMTAYITGTSTRKVDDLGKALGCDTGSSKSSVSRICKFIDPGSPWQNAWIESFNARLRDELLNVWQFDSLLEARVHLADWRIDCNCNRAHTAHGDLTPTEFASTCTINQPKVA